jgi:phosphoglycerate kinase
VEALTQGLKPGEVLLLENLRFHPEEEKNDAEFARQLARLGDVYVDDAFGSAHRAHASTAAVADYIPAVSGFLMEKELAALGGALDQPRRPFAAVIGGAKVSDKIGVLAHLLTKVDVLIIGGGMANTFLLAQGKEVGRSLVEPAYVATAQDLLQKAAKAGVQVLLPHDAVVTTSYPPQPGQGTEVPQRTVPISHIEPTEAIVDIGPRTRELYRAEVLACWTIVWNGPMGICEVKPFDAGTREVAEALVQRTEEGAITVVGGGDSVAAVQSLGLARGVTHLSTGGGASLEFLEGKTLPGVAVLADR